MNAPPNHPTAHPPIRPSLELITTGAELLSGRTVNRHAQTLGDALAPLGLQLVRDTTVPDDQAAIEDAVRGALARVDLVIVSGGLGPTSDDVTRDVLCAITGQTLVMNEEARVRIAERYARSGRVLNPSVERHALVLSEAAVLQNSAGLAPGERIEIPGGPRTEDGRQKTADRGQTTEDRGRRTEDRGRKTVFLLPGPPREFQSVLTEHVLPWLREHAAVTPPDLRVFRVCGIGESEIATSLTMLALPPPGLDDVAYCAQPGRVEIRLSAPPAAAAALESAVRMVRDGLGDHIFAEERIDLPAVVASRLGD